MDKFTKKHNIDRKAASKLLKVSLRTVDRYIKQKKLASRVVSGRIWLDKNETIDFRDRHRVDKVDTDVDMSTVKLSIDKSVDIDPKNVDTVSTLMSTPHDKDLIYKRLYEEAKKDLGDKQDRLEGAHYRVGQLEAQLKYSVPLLDYQRETNKHKEKEEGLRVDIEKMKNHLESESKTLRSERLNKHIFLVILFILLMLQPLWLLAIKKPW